MKCPFCHSEHNEEKCPSCGASAPESPKNDGQQAEKGKGNSNRRKPITMLIVAVFAVLVLRTALNEVVDQGSTTNLASAKPTGTKKPSATPEQKATPTITPEPTIFPGTENFKSLSEEEYKKGASEISSHSALLRRPTDYILKDYVVTIKIAQIIESEETGLIHFRGYTQDTEANYESWYKDEYIITDLRKNKSEQIYNDDIIKVYGEYEKPIELERVLGRNSTVPKINARYIEFPADEE